MNSRGECDAPFRVPAVLPATVPAGVHANAARGRAPGLRESGDESLNPLVYLVADATDRIEVLA
jgi:hypothetical protein